MRNLITAMIEKRLSGGKRNIKYIIKYTVNNVKRLSFGKKHSITYKKIHPSEKSYLCNQCEKSFPQKLYLIIHQRIHTSDKTYKCNECDESFSQKNSILAN